MSKLEHEESDNFDVENSDDLAEVIEAGGEEPNPQADSEESIVIDGEQKDEPKAQEEEEKPKKKSRTQRRIERITRENVELREKLADTKPEPKGEPEEINIDDFDDYDKYLEAVRDQETKVKEPKVDDEQPKLFADEALRDAVEDGAEDYDDFDTMIRAKDLALTGSILGTVLESEIASDILYHLANNKDETRKIAGMTPRQQTKALMKIELSLESKPRGTVKKKKISKAPEPITPVDGNAPKATSLDDDDISFGEYEKEFNRQQTAQQSNGWA